MKIPHCFFSSLLLWTNNNSNNLRALFLKAKTEKVGSTRELPKKEKCSAVSIHNFTPLPNLLHSFLPSFTSITHTPTTLSKQIVCIYLFFIFLFLFFLFFECFFIFYFAYLFVNFCLSENILFINTVIHTPY